jgi:SAM-dependent methyltransferase
MFENLLAGKRARIAEKAIPAKLRKGRILDIGCGSCPLFLFHTDFSEKYGLDKTTTVCARDELQTGKVVLKTHDIEAENTLPFQDGFFDVVTMLAVFEHIFPERLPALTGEIYRVLKKGGAYIITTPSWWSDPILRMAARLKMVSALEIAEHKDVYNREKVVSILVTGGFLRDRIEGGYFELFMNMWVKAIK